MAVAEKEPVEAGAYIPVSIATLSSTRTLDFDLYSREGSDGKFRLFRDRSVPISSQDFNKLASRGIRNLYMELDAHASYQHYLRENFSSVLNDSNLTGAQRCGCLNEVVRSTLSEAFASGSTSEAIDAAQQLAFQTVDLVSQGEVTTSELLSVIHHDYHTFTHSANVSYYCVLLAESLGITDQTELSEIGTGGLLHDLGKLQIPEAILTKPGKLTDEEFAAIKRHPTEGFRLLSNREDLSYAQLMMVYQHHEKIDGSGYPVGVCEQHIHPWAKICAVVDVYEALTSNRPYRSGLKRDVVFEIMDRGSGSHFDAEVWECWKTTIQQS